MRKPEQRLYDRMRRALFPLIRLERIENAVGTGRPDVDALANGIFTPIELKCVAAPPVRVTTPVLGDKKGLNRDQRNWHLDWRNYGGRSLIVVGIGREVFAIGGWAADGINAMTLDDLRANAVATSFDALAMALGAHPDAKWVAVKMKGQM